MKEIKLPLARLYELAIVVDNVPMSELGLTKDIRLTASLVDDLKSASKEFSEKNDNLANRKAVCAKVYQDEYQVKKETLSEDELKKVVAELDVRLSVELKEKFEAEEKTLEEEGKVEKMVELGDDKFTKLKEIFEKFAAKRYLKREVYLQVADALEVE